MRRIATCIALLLSSVGEAQLIKGKSGITLTTPPSTEKRPVTDTYKVAGKADVTITDDYRWLEDASSPATRAFIAAQNAYTQKYLGQVKILPEVRTQMAALLRVDQMTVPTERAGKYFFSRQMANENQGSIYMRVGLHGEDIKLIDANGRSADGNTSVNIEDITQDGSILVYRIRVGGADESEVHFYNVQLRTDMTDILPSARYYGVQVSPDKHGVYYSQYFRMSAARCSITHSEHRWPQTRCC